jgi:hypothetical protein
VFDVPAISAAEDMAGTSARKVIKINPMEMVRTTGVPFLVLWYCWLLFKKDLLSLLFSTTYPAYFRWHGTPERTLAPSCPTMPCS